jgi:hypothetical protein
MLVMVGGVLMVVLMFPRLLLLRLLLLAVLVMWRMMVMMLHRRSRIDVHFLGITSKRRNRSRVQDRARTESTTG